MSRRAHVLRCTASRRHAITDSSGSWRSTRSSNSPRRCSSRCSPWCTRWRRGSDRSTGAREPPEGPVHVHVGSSGLSSWDSPSVKGGHRPGYSPTNPQFRSVPPASPDGRPQVARQKRIRGSAVDRRRPNQCTIDERQDDPVRPRRCDYGVDVVDPKASQPVQGDHRSFLLGRCPGEHESEARPCALRPSDPTGESSVAGEAFPRVRSQDQYRVRARSPIGLPDSPRPPAGSCTS